jgi:flagellar biosynthesis protein FlhF
MEPISFIASSAAEAVEQIRARLGPEAVVLNVRPLPAQGFNRLWQTPKIEVLAHVPGAAPADTDPFVQVLTGFQKQLDEIRHQVVPPAAQPELQAIPEEPSPAPVQTPQPIIEPEPEVETGSWKIGAVLRSMGLLPLHAQNVVDALAAQHGEKAPELLSEQMRFACAYLSRRWRSSSPLPRNSLHVLVGPAGSGKTTSLCKWVTQAALVEGKTSRVWRLDGATANMAESLSVYTDILGLPCERFWQPGPFSEDVGFIDLPGVDWRKPIVIKELASQLKQLGSPKVHLVLNCAYDVSVLMAQVRAFASLGLEDLILTHLDEETRWGKIWNLALGTNYSIRQLSTGQNIPGDFLPATADLLLNGQTPVK